MTGLARAVLAAPLVFGAFVTPALAQHLGGGAEVGISLVRVISALLLCLAAAVGIVLALRARGGKSSAGLGKLTGIYRDHRIRIIESRRISPHCDVCLFSFDDEEFLIACGSAGPTLLERRPFRVESPAQS